MLCHVSHIRHKINFLSLYLYLSVYASFNYNYDVIFVNGR